MVYKPKMKKVGVTQPAALCTEVIMDTTSMDDFKEGTICAYGISPASAVPAAREAEEASIIL